MQRRKKYVSHKGEELKSGSNQKNANKWKNKKRTLSRKYITSKAHHKFQVELKIPFKYAVWQTIMNAGTLTNVDNLGLFSIMSWMRGECTAYQSCDVKRQTCLRNNPSFGDIRKCHIINFLPEESSCAWDALLAENLRYGVVVWTEKVVCRYIIMTGWTLTLFYYYYYCYYCTDEEREFRISWMGRFFSGRVSGPWCGSPEKRIDFPRVRTQKPAQRHQTVAAAEVYQLNEKQIISPRQRWHLQISSHHLRGTPEIHRSISLFVGSTSNDCATLLRQ